MPLNPQRKIDLSPEALAALRLPLKANDWELLDADKRLVASLDYCAQDAELAAFIAALVNEALTPAAPSAGHIAMMADTVAANERHGTAAAEWLDKLTHSVNIAPDNNTELRQIVTTELEAEQRWTAEDIMRREG